MALAESIGLPPPSATFALPVVMTVLGKPEYYFSYFWPLKIEYLYPHVILQYPFLIVLWSVLGSLVVFPVAGYFLGKRFYCSWICGCGGLANTAGEPFRHLSDRSARAWRFEKVSLYSVLALAVVTTILVALNWAIGPRYPRFSAFAFPPRERAAWTPGARREVKPTMSHEAAGRLRRASGPYSRDSLGLRTSGGSRPSPPRFSRRTPSPFSSPSIRFTSTRSSLPG